ncbi:MAG: hypothetical protein D6758_04410 [Gammaproteobacteria bacterium]|nr:MAG: hypothetical protein D6758_04410 [Gammaproteobacteria bacterium]
MNVSDLYLEEVFTDNKVGTIRRMTPVDANGQRDPNRDVKYIGLAQMMTPAGTLPLTFELNAQTLGEAAEQFGEEAKKAMERTLEELKELRRQAASSIVVPGQEGGMGGLGGAGGLGGMPGGGKIQMP